MSRTGGSSPSGGRVLLPPHCICAGVLATWPLMSVVFCSRFPSVPVWVQECGAAGDRDGEVQGGEPSCGIHVVRH